MEGGGRGEMGGGVDKERKCKMIGVRDKREKIQKAGTCFPNIFKKKSRNA